MIITKNQSIYIAGHSGMVGCSCWKTLKSAGYLRLIGRSSNEIDLRDQKSVFNFLKEFKPEVIINAAAKVGGILANNSYPYDFLMDNMLIQNNLIRAAHELDIKKFIFLGSSCIYPKLADQPIKESYLLSSSLEPTNEWYAIAKIAGVKLIEALNKQFNRKYLSLMPTNLYGPNDNFSLETSHVLPAMIRKFHESKINNHNFVNLWGSGNPKREFLHVDDLARAVLHAIENDLPEHLYNVGTGMDLTIKELSEIVKDEVGFKGEILWDSSKPDGTPRKLLDVSKLKNQGWLPQISLVDGVKATYSWYKENINDLRNVKIN